MSIKRFAFTVHGTVQGVFFRKYTRESADALSISGFVQNLKNGCVAGEAEGSPDNLERFREKLREGSQMSHVEKVDWNEIAIRKEGEGQGYMKAHSFDRFSIKRGKH